MISSPIRRNISDSTVNTASEASSSIDMEAVMYGNNDIAMEDDALGGDFHREYLSIRLDPDVLVCPIPSTYVELYENFRFTERLIFQRKTVQLS